MKLSIISHCAMDTIHLEGLVHQQTGGDAAYTGIMCRKFGADVNLQTRFGSDFPYAYLENEKMKFENASSSCPTTRFTIKMNGRKRDLYLTHQCEPIHVSRADHDGTIIAPIYHEIQKQDIPGHCGYVLLNPQGLLRLAGSDGLISTVSTNLDLNGISALKVNPLEIAALCGTSGDKGMQLLHKQGVETVIRTNGESISMLHDSMLYSIRLPNKEIHDTTGLGAILCGAFVCTMLKERDALWALCFAGGAVQAALDTKKLGLLKVPARGAIQTNASYFYNLVEFKRI